MKLAPIALFAYKRPEHTRRTLEALMKCPEFSESQFFVFCDGAKQAEDQDAVDKTRKIVKALVGNSAEITEFSHNQGLANSIITGVTHLVDKFGKIIVLEDDLIVSPNFLRYMNRGLDRYRDEGQVMQISGYMFPIPEFADRHEAIFLPITVSWGWATWQRAWQQFDPDATDWEILKEDKQMRKRFNFDGAYDYFSIIERQFCGDVDSWAIRWYWTFFRADGLTLFPPVSYVENIGFDRSGSHGWGGGKIFSNKFRLSKLDSIQFPKNRHLDKNSVIAVQKMMSKSESLFMKTARLLVRLVRKIRKAMWRFSTE